MELHFPSIVFIFSFLVFLFTIVKILLQSKTLQGTSQGLLPPGPWRLPLIGNLHQLFGSLPHHRLRDLAKQHGPLMHLQLGEVSTVVVSSPEVAKEVLKTHDLIFAQRPLLVSAKFTSYDYTNIGLAPYGNYWRQLRRICTVELLSANRVQSFRSIREEEVSNLIKAVGSNSEGSAINLSEGIFTMTFGITARAAFGKKCKDQESFINVVKEFIQIMSGFSIADLYPSVRLLQEISGVRHKLEKLHLESDRIFEEIIDEHKRKRKKTKSEESAEAGEDLVDVFLNLQEDGDLEFPLTDNNIKAVIWDIFVAGSDTSSTTVEWAMAEMLKNPRVMKEAQAEVRRVFNGKENVDETGIHELKFLKLVVKETLRLHPPAPLLLPRESRESCRINGYTIPEKTRVIVNAWAIGRDPEYWTEAETFCPERFMDSSVDYRGTDFEFIPFGAGRRVCPGITFALPNIELPLAQLLYHFDWKLPSAGMKHQDLDMTEDFGLTIRRKNDLLLIPSSRGSSSDFSNVENTTSVKC